MNWLLRPCHLLMLQYVLSPAIARTAVNPVCMDPFQMNVNECFFVKINGGIFGYDSERDECREIKDSFLCTRSQHALFKVLL